MNTLAIDAAQAVTPIPGRNRVLGLLWLCYTLSILDRYAMGILAEPIKRDLQVSDTTLGLLTARCSGCST